MTDLVSIAGGAVAAYQRALGTVSNNIANVDSEGYTRQEASLIENAPRSYGTSYLGTGVNVLGIKRMYDAFIENSLRSANTELGTQESLVNYANRVVDILGSEDVGLLSAFDQFFDAARQLATDASSIILREQFISKADALTSRFKTLNSQLHLVAQETQEAIRSEVSSLNSLSEQLTLVNTQLGKTKLLNRQPPALMDQRDEILRQMASLAKINVTEMQNGQVKVAIGASSTRGEIVSLTDFRPLTAVFNSSSVGKVDLVIDAGSPQAENVIGFSGGSLAGLMGFRSQLLEPSFGELDNLAKTLLSSVNAIHSEGIDLEGRDGLELFQIDPQFSLTATSGDTAVRYSATVDDLAAYETHTLRLDYRANAGQTNSVVLSGEYRAGEQITVNLNGSEKRFVITGANEGDVVALSEVQSQLRNFLEGGNGSSVGGAFGLQIDARDGTGTDILVSSSLLGAFNLKVTTTSEAGRIDESISRGQWTVTDTVSGSVSSGVNSVEMNGIRLDLTGDARDGEILFLNIANSASAGIRVALDDPGRVAAAARFRVIENQFNPSKASASLFETPENFEADQDNWLDRLVGDAPYFDELDNNVLESESIRFNGPKTTPLAIVPAGYSDTTLFLGEIGEVPINLQVMTRDGRHLLGQFYEPSEERVAAEKLRLGRDELTAAEMSALYDEAGEEAIRLSRIAGVSFSIGATYSHQYLNGAGENSYRAMDLFYGVRADVQEVSKLTVDHVYGAIERTEASVTSGAIGSITAGFGDVIYSEGDFVFNGIALGQLKLVDDGLGNPLLQLTRTNEYGESVTLDLPLEGTDPLTFSASPNGAYTIDASHLKAYFDAHNYDRVLGVPSVYSRGGVLEEFSKTFGVTVTVNTLDSGGQSLTFSRKMENVGEQQAIDFSDSVDVAGTLDVGGVSVAIAAGDTASEVAEKVATALRDSPAFGAQSGRSISISNSRLVITYRVDEEDADIVETSLSTSTKPNITVSTIRDAFVDIPNDPDPRDKQIRLGLGQAGKTTQLAALGFRTGVYLVGEIKEDLFVFADGEAGGFRLGATFSQGSRDAVATLRAEPYEVTFIGASRYLIRDVETGSVVAEREYDPSLGVSYRGVTLKFNEEPAVGDRFLVDGNQDGIGSNGTAVRLSELESQQIVGRYTLSQAYGNLVGDTGNVAFQAEIAQKALEVVKDQAVQARDKASGVSLDQEAADLIRFQQAYQASAKVMQTANALFDAILGIR